MKPSRIAAAALATLAAQAVMAQQPAPATLSLSATAQVEAAPDIAEIGAGVVTQAADAQAALSANSQKMTAVLAALRKAGVADLDIRTAGLSVQPQFRYQENQPPQLTGFQAANRVEVTLRDLKNAGRVIDALVAEGANQIDGPSFRVDNPEPLLDKARAEAVSRARARAELYAKAAGLAITRITAISEGVEQRPPSPMPRLMAMEAASAAPAPVSPGQVQLAATVTMAFEMAPR